MKTEPVHVHLDSGEYVIIPRAEYQRLLEGAGDAPKHAPLPLGSASAGKPEGLPLAEAKAAVLREMGRRVRSAREQAELTQAALASKLGVTQAMVSRAESGTARVSSAYIGRVLKACKLPPDWTRPTLWEHLDRTGPANEAKPLAEAAAGNEGSAVPKASRAPAARRVAKSAKGRGARA